MSTAHANALSSFGACVCQASSNNRQSRTIDSIDQTRDPRPQRGPTTNYVSWGWRGSRRCRNQDL